MILVTDVHYFDNQAIAAGILFQNWEDEFPKKEITAEISEVEAYVSGAFYKRELPCLLALLDKLDEMPECIIVDGHVFLGKTQKAGLGKYLYDALDGKIPIIGVAKNSFEGTPEETKVYRGGSTKPLFVTSIGCDNTESKAHIKNMHGAFRFPTLLKKVDQLCRQIS